jgi:alkylation response protein AidB-like acyl-CoA dehydrogenase
VIKVSSVWMAPTGIFNSHLIMAAAIERCGTEEQKRAGCRASPPASCAAARPDRAQRRHRPAGDPHRGRRDGDHYVINGTKTWITNSMHGDTVSLLLVKTDPEASRATRA